MRLAALVDISEKVSATSRRKEKAALMAGLLHQAGGEEIALAARFL